MDSNAGNIPKCIFSDGDEEDELPEEDDFDTAIDKTYAKGDKIVVTFTATDASGNETIKTRTYNVIANS